MDRCIEKYTRYDCRITHVRNLEIITTAYTRRRTGSGSHITFVGLVRDCSTLKMISMRFEVVPNRIIHFPTRVFGRLELFTAGSYDDWLRTDGGTYQDSCLKKAEPQLTKSKERLGTYSVQLIHRARMIPKQTTPKMKGSNITSEYAPRSHGL